MAQPSLTSKISIDDVDISGHVERFKIEIERDTYQRFGIFEPIPVGHPRVTVTIELTGIEVRVRPDGTQELYVPADALKAAPELRRLAAGEQRDA